MSKALCLYLFLACAFPWFAQQKPDLIWPLDSPRVITGNFGEIRPNHFHTGLDFSTNGRENLQVYAIEEGYVSRIKVSPYGYGKALYITHANGRVSLYAHLNTFSLKIDKVLRQEQLRKRSFEVDFYPEPWSVFVRKNEIVALSGNTGGSTGPHLHFELRDEKTERPMNPLTLYHLEDKVPPVLERIQFLDVSDPRKPVSLLGLEVKDGELPVHDTFYLAFRNLGLSFLAYDQYVRNGNRNNVHGARILLDNETVYDQQFSLLDFNDLRYVNEYAPKQERYKFQKCFVPQHYPEYLYTKLVNQGKIILNDKAPHRLEVQVFDEAGNQKAYTCFIRLKAHLSPLQDAPVSHPVLNCLRDTLIAISGLHLRIPARSFYHDVPFSLKVDSLRSQITIEPADANLHRPVLLSLTPPGGHSKLILRGPQGILSPEQRNDSLVFALKQTGTFEWLYDREAPVLKSKMGKGKKQRANQGGLFFTISDDLSGIGGYDVFVNEEWVIAEYDAKNQSLFYLFDENTTQTPLEVRVELSDKCGNRSTYRFSFRR